MKPTYPEYQRKIHLIGGSGPSPFCKNASLVGRETTRYTLNPTEATCSACTGRFHHRKARWLLWLLKNPHIPNTQGLFMSHVDAAINVGVIKVQVLKDQIAHIEMIVGRLRSEKERICEVHASDNSKLS